MENTLNMDLVDKHVMPVAEKISNNKYLMAIRDGIALMMPFMIIGSFFLILAFLPIPGYDTFMASVFGETWMDKVLYPVGATYDLIAIFASVGTAYRLAQRYNGLEPIIAAAITIAAYMLVTPYAIDFTVEATGSQHEVYGLAIDYLGSKGMFLGIIIAIYSTEVYRWMVSRNITFKLPDSVPPAVLKSFSALLPAFVVITSLAILRIAIEAVDLVSLHAIVTTVVSAPLTALGSSVIGTMLAEFAEHALWATGIHGSSVVGSVMSPIWLTLTDENRMAFQAGLEIPNIINQQFVEIFIWFGGSGGILALVLLLVFRSRSAQCKSIGKLGFGASIFNISEPIMFGLPVVLNPILIIPFIITPMVCVLTTYFAMASGLVALPAGIAVPWTTPIFLSGYLVTGGHVSGAILQLFNLALAMAIYYPFFRKWDGICLNSETK
ncbi:PTS cellobiose transporter subunit IIC [Vibrio sp. SS-MA-C1-2]|uniref:PTS cellobiose transporter subunit IIC n=1 Tax=Vibrio sp. SS-MA-C1-2 TaxID=2908646 RepID=UPI001F39775A|nr:PTS cellobiose transporter subunit IIC [Vibrio sp. SS-MA-C1-2]UJF18500.1 PTS cellobiose transporter subunit IIC [Vibrio sp. SS-MA-C1-2]